MELAVIVLKQVAILVIFVAMGILAVKAGKITVDVSKNLSNLLLYFIGPFLIIDSLAVPYDPAKTTGFVVTLGLSAVIHLLFILGSKLLLRKGMSDNLPVERYAAIFCNTGYIGIPLIQGIFGKGAVFYLVAFMIAFNIFSWTYGMWILQKEVRLTARQMLLNPGNLASLIGLALYFSRITLPDMVASVVSSIASTNTFLSLFAVGVVCSQIDFRSLLQSRRVLYVALCRLVLLPLAVFALVIWWIPLVLPETGSVIASVLTVASMTPCAMSLSFMCQISGRDPVYGSQILALSTVLCVITVPVLTTLLTSLVR